LYDKIFKNLDGLLNKQSIGIDNKLQSLEKDIIQNSLGEYSFKPLKDMLNDSTN